MIRPTMKEIGSYIKKLGHNYRIEDFEKKERISMIIIPNSMNGFNLMNQLFHSRDGLQR